MSDAPSTAMLENCWWVYLELVSKGDLELRGHVSSYVDHSWWWPKSSSLVAQGPLSPVSDLHFVFYVSSVQFHRKVMGRGGGQPKAVAGSKPANKLHAAKCHPFWCSQVNGVTWTVALAADFCTASANVEVWQQRLKADVHYLKHIKSYRHLAWLHSNTALNQFLEKRQCVAEKEAGGDNPLLPWSPQK